MTKQASERSFRPKTFEDFTGQPEIINQLSIFIEASKKRKECLDHVLLYGPPGLGKTTLASIIANEMGGHLITSSGPLLQKPADLVSLLVSLELGSVLFIDEIHRIPIQVEEILYSAMEDLFLDILAGEADRKSIRITLEPFTLVGATTRAGQLSAPLRDRFGMVFRMEYYNIYDLTNVIERAATELEFPLSHKTAEMLAARSRGTPRIALKNLKRVRDIIQTSSMSGRSVKDIAAAMAILGVNEQGLDEQDQNYLKALHNTFAGEPVGLRTLAAALGEDPGTIEDSIEPFLIQEGYISRTPRGRMITSRGIGLAHAKHPSFTSN